MKKIVVFLMILLILTSSFGFAEKDSEKIWCVVEQHSGQMISGSREEEQRFPAGLTKLMSFLLLFEALDAGKVRTGDVVTISRNAAKKGGSSVFLDEGANYSFGELLRAAVISSGNDATTALAEYAAGSETVFVEQMNRRAEELGLQCSFADATGLSTETRVSAKDLATIAAELANFSQFFEYSSIWTETFEHKNGRETELTSANQLIKSEAYDGMATGSSKEAGYCLVASMPQNGSRFLCVVLGAENSAERFSTASGLLGTAAAAYQPYEIVTKGTRVKNISVPGAKEKETALYAAEDLALLLPKEQEVQKKIHLRENLAAPLSAGEKAGDLIVTTSDGSIYTVDLIVREAVEEGSLRGSILRILGLWTQKSDGEAA